MKTQKNIVISFVMLLIQFAIIWIPEFVNIAVPRTIGITLFWIFGIISVIYAVIALIKKEAASGVGIILLELLFFYWFVYMGK